MASYLLESTLCWLLFYGFYALTLSRETFFQLNRYYLLGTLALGALIPHLEVPIDWVLQTPEVTLSTWLPLAEVGATPTITITAPATNNPFDIKALVTLVYWLGVAFTGLRFIIGLSQIFRLYLQGHKTFYHDYTLIGTQHTHLPFSFGNWLFMNNQSNFSADEAEKIVRHELAHIRGKHTLDVLLLELASIFLWWCLPIYWYRRSLRTVHEYLADRVVLRTAGRKEYGHLLIRQTQTGMQPAIANHFFHSQLKKRILMMTKTKSGKPALLKYLTVFPLLVLAMLLFANREALAQVNVTSPTPTEAKPADKSVHIVSEGPAEIVLPEPGSKPEPLYILNGKEVSSEDVAKIDPNNIEKVEVLKGESATKLKGGRGANGVVLIETIYNVVSYTEYELPHFPGCEEIADKEARLACAQKKMSAFFAENLKFPETEDRTKLASFVVVSFTTTVDGSIVEPKLLFSRPFCKVCEEEVLRVVNLMPQWIPAKKDGKAVKSNMQLPVQFGDITKPSGSQENKAGDEEIFKVVEEMPRFPSTGCEDNPDATLRKNCADKAMLEFIYKNIKYPKAARDEGIEGTVVVSFVVDKNGSVRDAAILREIGGGCGDEVLRLIGQMPNNWVPGKQRGRSVHVQYNLPVRFKLDSPSEAVKKPELDTPAPASTQQKVLEINKFSASPNPASKEVRVYFEAAAKPVTVRLVDSAQKVIYEQTVEAFDGVYDKTINLGRAAKGLVYIFVSQEGSEPFVQKLVVQ